MVLKGGRSMVELTVDSLSCQVLGSAYFLWNVADDCIDIPSDQVTYIHDNPTVPIQQKTIGDAMLYNIVLLPRHLLCETNSHLAITSDWKEMRHDCTIVTPRVATACYK